MAELTVFAYESTSEDAFITELWMERPRPETIDWPHPGFLTHGIESVMLSGWVRYYDPD